MQPGKSRVILVEKLLSDLLIAAWSFGQAKVDCSTDWRHLHGWTVKPVCYWNKCMSIQASTARVKPSWVLIVLQKPPG